MVKILAWYDNEWGFSNRLVDLALLMAKKRALTPASHALLKSTPGVDFLTLPRQIKCEFDGGAIPLNLVILLI
ncbi:erythrose 4-phosphate dehydrogenase [Citrobacter freundii]|nr:erythrose 4-phosphate dehydrogenase [Citrobacter freundii]